MKELTVNGKSIKELAETYLSEYGFVGIRTQEQPFELGDINHLSVVWEDGEETEEELDGISVTDIRSKYVAMHADNKKDGLDGFYYGDHVAIIAGYSAEGGGDEGELIIKDAVVVEILK